MPFLAKTPGALGAEGFEKTTDMRSLHLDHDPALENRRKVFVKGKHVGYVPDDLDPDYLIYRDGVLS